MKIGCGILAGGKSCRMGADKALLEFGDDNFIKRISHELSCFDERMIARGEGSQIADVSWAVIADVYPGCGPIGGMHAVLSACQSDAMFFVACDMPLVKRGLASRLCRMMFGEDKDEQGKLVEAAWDAVVAVTADGKVHPLCGVYRKSVCSVLETQILSGENKVMRALGRMRVKYVRIDTPEGMRQLWNVNTPEDYAALTRGEAHHWHAPLCSGNEI